MVAMCKIFLLVLALVVTINSMAQSKPDTRTPSDRYQGAFTAAWLGCTLETKLANLKEAKRQKRMEVDSSREDDLLGIDSCIKNGLDSMKVEYKNMLTIIAKTKGAEDALTNHFVSAVLTVRGISYRAESDADFMQRLNENRKKTEELWIRFEITQP